MAKWHPSLYRKSPNFYIVPLLAFFWPRRARSTRADLAPTVKRARAITRSITSRPKSGNTWKTFLWRPSSDESHYLSGLCKFIFKSPEPFELLNSVQCQCSEPLHNRLQNRRGDLDGEKIVKAASKADCVLALNGESCSAAGRTNHEWNDRRRRRILSNSLYALFTLEQTV